jgi:hypothetical protein
VFPFKENALRIFRPNRQNVAGIQRKVYKEGLHNLYCSYSIRERKLRRIMWDRHIARMEEMRMWASSISFNKDWNLYGGKTKA